MPSIFYPLIFLFLTNIFIEQTTCALPEYLQNLELDDITSLWDKFPSIINQIKQAGMLLENDFLRRSMRIFFLYFKVIFTEKRNWISYR